jgi:cytochrome c
MSDPPTQVEQGHYTYWLSCMVCHGDEGQGLTAGWRGKLDPADQNCWQAKCHASSHPPEGFELPRYAPPVIGPNRLAHHETAAGLYQYISTRMPWQAPGLLSSQDYWQLTAFLIDANGISLNGQTLGPENADTVYLGPQPTPAQATEGRAVVVWLPTVTVGVILLLGALFLGRRLWIS